MHSEKIIHRDLKGANLLMNNEGILKICDFGLGRWMNSHYKYMTSEVVTFPYRAPELFYGNNQYNEKVDIWSVGCIFAELFIKRVLFAR